MFPKNSIKNGLNLRVIAVDDGRFIKKNSDQLEKAPFFCVLWKNFIIERVRIGQITVDGLDSTRTLFRMLKGLNFDLIMLSGISFGGFNLIDAQTLFKCFKKPIIVISGTKPHNLLVRRALRIHFKDWGQRFSYIKQLGKIYCFKTVYSNPIYFEVIGLNYKKAKRMIRDLTFTGRYPEPIRVVRLLAQDLG